MLTGKSLSELAQEIERQAEAKRDFRAPTKQLEVVQVEKVEEKDLPRFALAIGDKGRFELNDTASSQLAQRYKIPMEYWRRMAEHAPQLLLQNANHWLHRNGDQAMVRCLFDRARAFLSPKYRTIDHFPVLQMLLPLLDELGVQVRSSQVTDHRMYLQVTTARLTGEVRVGDVVEAGLSISNSETGEGSYLIELLLWRLRCGNGMVIGEAVRRHHVGRHAEAEGEARELYSQETLALDDAALLSKTRDTVRALLAEAPFQRSLEAARGLTKITLPDLLGATQALEQEVIELRTEERASLRKLLVNGDPALPVEPDGWKLLNAVTALAHEAKDYDRAVELERAGGKLLALASNGWQRIAERKYDPKADARLAVAAN